MKDVFVCLEHGGRERRKEEKKKKSIDNHLLLSFYLIIFSSRKNERRRRRRHGDGPISSDRREVPEAASHRDLSKIVPGPRRISSKRSFFLFGISTNNVSLLTGSTPIKFGNTEDGCGTIDHKTINTTLVDPLTLIYMLKTTLKTAKATDPEYVDETVIRETCKKDKRCLSFELL